MTNNKTDDDDDYFIDEPSPTIADIHEELSSISSLLDENNKILNNLFYTILIVLGVFFAKYFHY